MCALVAGCVQAPVTHSGVRPEVAVTPAQLPSVVQTYAPIENTLQCIRQTGALRGKTFVVGPFADSTGKINASAPGATGNFIPQGGSAAYMTDALAKAGGRVVSTYFGPPAEAVRAQYAINGIFNSLDFGSPMATDVRVMGVGPTVAIGWAQLSLSVQLDEVSSRINRQMSMIQRPVRYTHLGGGIGHDFHGKLVTGNAVFQNQERLQFEAINGPIALGVIDVIFKEFPRVRAQCASEVAELLNIEMRPAPVPLPEQRWTQRASGPVYRFAPAPQVSAPQVSAPAERRRVEVEPPPLPSVSAVLPARAHEAERSTQQGVQARTEESYRPSMQGSWTILADGLSSGSR